MKLFATAHLLFLFLAPAICFAQDVHSRWISSPIVVDGNSNEWPQPFRYYDSNTKLQFAVANDSANIYVCLKVTDEPTQMKLFRAGLNIWIDGKGKHKQTTGVNFPMRVTVAPGELPEQKKRSEGQIPGQSFQKHDFNQMKARIMAHQQTLKLTGFAGVPDQTVPLQNQYGIIAAYEWDSFNILSIEYKIPIALALKHALAPTDTTKAIALGFLESAMESEQKGGESGESGGGGNWGNNGGGRSGMGGGGMSGGGMGGGGGMGRGGGGMGRGGGGGSSSSYNSANAEQKIWTKVILADR